jgi:hypothetical protein
MRKQSDLETYMERSDLNSKQCNGTRARASKPAKSKLPSEQVISVKQHGTATKEETIEQTSNEKEATQTQQQVETGNKFAKTNQGVHGESSSRESLNQQK